MPYGMSWPKFCSISMLSLLSTLAGSQAVHAYYKPLADMDILTSREVERLKIEKGIVDDSLK